MHLLANTLEMSICAWYHLYLDNFGWKPSLERRKEKRALFMYKIRNNELPKCLKSMFKSSNNKIYKLRSNELDFTLPKPNTNHCKKSFSVGAALWNDLPMSAKDRAISFRQFRAILNNMTE